MEIRSKNYQVITALFWKLGERGGTQGIQFIVQIILARLLLPYDYGLIALVSIFLTFANVLVQSGFSSALIQNKDADDVDFSSVLFLSLFVAMILYIVLFLTSPLISRFYNNPLLIPVIRVLSLTLFFDAFNSVQYVVLVKKMQFKKLFFNSIGAILVSGTIGIVMAYAGYGVWALVIQQIISRIMITTIFMYTIKWKPKLLFSFKRIKKLFSFAWKLLLSTLIDTLYMDLRSLIIGKIYKPIMLGFFNRGQQIPGFIVSNINGSIKSVIFPVLSSEQNNRKRVKDMVRRSIVTSSFLVLPLMAGVAVVAEPLVKIILTDKWLPCVPFLRIFCVIYALWPMQTANIQAINAIGRSDIVLKLEIIKKIIGLTILGITLFYGVYAIALGGVISGLISTIINAYPNRKLFGYSYKEQCKDIAPSLLLSLAVGTIVYGINFLDTTVWLTLLLQVTIGVTLYICLAKVLKFECLEYLIQMGKEVLKTRKGVSI